jgi:hypothetical protein
MAKIGRNARCPCGSGRKYKNCCGNPIGQRRGSKFGRLSVTPRGTSYAFERQRARELIRTEQQGLGRPIISASIGEYRLVAVGGTLHYSKKWKFFADFLSDYIKNTLGHDWGNAEIAKPVEQRHPIMQWYDAFCHFQRNHQKKPDGTYVANSTGIVYCYLGLAYNLYLLKHNAELQERFIARLPGYSDDV